MSRNEYFVAELEYSSNIPLINTLEGIHSAVRQEGVDGYKINAWIRCTNKETYIENIRIAVYEEYEDVSISTIDVQICDFENCSIEIHEDYCVIVGRGLPEVWK